MRNSLKTFWSVLVAGTVATICCTRAATERTQTINLKSGWNAVFLEVFPDEAEPSKLFSGTPVEIVAAYYAGLSSAQFVSNPSANLFAQSGWAVWYSPSRADGFLTTLYAIQGPQAFLVYTKADFVWQVRGAVLLPDIRWQPGSFNLVGFSVDGIAPPTFRQFFSASKPHQHNRIYRLNNGAWRQVSDPSAETMRSGEAFWIYCDGGSQFQGPIQVETETKQGLVLRDAVKALILRNKADYPIKTTVEHVGNAEDGVPLSVVVTAVGDKASPVRSIAVSKPRGAWSQELPPLEAGGAIKVPFQARRQDQTTFTRSSLLKISTDIGALTWVPVFSIREDLEEK